MSRSLEGVLIKTPNKSEKYTMNQLVEFAKCADPITGPYYFLQNYFYIQHATKGKMLYSPFPYQIELAKTYHENRFSVNLLGRQLGKTTTAAGYLLWYAMFVADSTILVAAHKFTGSQEIMQRIRYAYESCPNFIRAGVTSYNKGSIDFENGSRIISTTTTENTGRGLSISLLYSDELAFVRPNIAKEFWTSISPTLATGGKAIITSTPNSDEDQFWNIWTEANKCFDEYGNVTHLGRNGFRAFKAVWNEHPDRDEKWAAEERSKIGDERFEREHNCLPIVFEETLINSMILSTLEGVDPILKQGQVRWYKTPKKHETYIVSLDPSLGTGGDDAAIQVFEMSTLEQVAEWQHNKTIVQMQVQLIKEICEYIYSITGSDTSTYYSVENNTLGEAALVAIAEYGEENIRGIFISEPAKIGNVRRYRKGFNTSNKTKIAVCSKFKQLLEKRSLKINSKNLISQLKVYVASGASFEARTGEKDDLVSAALLNCRIMQTLQSFDPDLDQKMKSPDEIQEPLPFIAMMG